MPFGFYLLAKFKITQRQRAHLGIIDIVFKALCIACRCFVGDDGIHFDIGFAVFAFGFVFKISLAQNTTRLNCSAEGETGKLIQRAKFLQASI